MGPCWGTLKPPIFLTGDLVYLKSGGPRMTVREINNPYSDVRRVDVVCDWFDHNAGHHIKAFAAGQLTKVDPAGV
jgi:uncharacterized protein YodC (DUF2158 family)